MGIGFTPVKDFKERLGFALKETFSAEHAYADDSETGAEVEDVSVEYGPSSITEYQLILMVEDTAKHALMAGLAGAYLAYLDCTRKEAGEKMQVVAAFTAGDSDNLMVGRNGIFYDRKGKDWDATIAKIVDNPISLLQAFWSPYKKFVRYLEEQVNKRAAAADAEADKTLGVAALTTVHVDKAKPPEPKKLDVGTVAALGVAVGAILGLILLISTPSVIMAYMKLRKRNLGPILDANGWAVNAKARINVPFGATLSRVAKLPSGSKRDATDPYAEKGFPWKRVTGLLLLLYGAFRWYTGSLKNLLPEPVRATFLLGKWAPKAGSILPDPTIPSK